MTERSFAGQPRPQVTAEQVVSWLNEFFGLTGELTELGSQQDRNFVVSGQHGRVLAKVSTWSSSRSEVDAQHVVMRAVATTGLATPLPLPTGTGSDVAEIDVNGQAYLLRLLEFVDGTPLIDFGYFTDSLLAEVGRIVARVSRTLASVEHPGLARTFQWDLRRGASVVSDLLPHVRDVRRRSLIELTLSELDRRLTPLVSALPVQAVHGDLTDDNIVADRAIDGRPIIRGVIDFGDASYGWRIAELVVACTGVLLHRPQDPLAVLPLIEAYHAERALTDAEIDALWPLIVLRAAVLVVSGEQQAAVDPTNHYAASAREREWLMFTVPAAADGDVFTAMIRHRLGIAHRRPQVPTPRHSLLGDSTVTPVDLDFRSRSFESGSWLRGATEETRILHDAARRCGAAVTRFKELRLTQAHAVSKLAPTNGALAVEVVLAQRRELLAPDDVQVSVRGNVLALVGPGWTIFIEGAQPLAEGPVLAGNAVALSAKQLRLWWVIGEPDRVPPAYVRAEELPGWDPYVLDPAPLLGLASTRRNPDDAIEVLARRAQTFGSPQEHYYSRPPQIERGWREYLIDINGRHYLDMVNNVTVLGHGHPRIAEAAADQWQMLNTNSRFHYSGIPELSERLLATLPASFDTVLMVNSGTEAVDLALRLSKAFTGRDDVLCLGESYHGWSFAADAVSTSLSDNPLAAETRPSWVHVADPPNAYRGVHRGPAAGPAYAADAIELLERCAAGGQPIGTFIAEPRNGNAGAIAVPARYLAAVYAAVRSGGGVSIADEVQVGYGRQGDVFWGFQQHDGVVPDIITMAKAMGDGHPLGVVITRKEIAESLSGQGAFFSSAGGSSLSCRIGLTVLDVIEEERLQANALEVGNHLIASLEALAKRHALIGAVHGRGLYLGLELVRDRETLEPAAREAAAICARLLDLGFIVQPTGERQNVLKIKPPLCFTVQSADYFVGALDEVLTSGW